MHVTVEQFEKVSLQSNWKTMNVDSLCCILLGLSIGGDERKVQCTQK